MSWLLRLFRRSVLVGTLLIFLVGAAVSSTLWALHLSSTVAMMSANAAATTVRHRQQMARSIARIKAKARLRRLIAAVPVVGAGAVIYFEEQDYQEWIEDNPDGTRSDYVCEVSYLSAEVIDEVLAELPEGLRPRPDTVLGWMPECRVLDHSSEITEID